jgi:WD40 repeat protein
LQDAQQADVSPDGKLVAISTGDSKVALYDTRSGQRLTLFTPDERHTGGAFLRFSPDGALLAFASGDPARATVWDVRKNKRIAWMQHSNGPEEIAFLPNSNVLAVANWQGVVFLWDYRRDPNPDPRKLERWRPHNGAVGSVAFSPDSKTLATSGEDHTLKLWNMATRREMVRLKIPTRGVSFLTFSPDGRTLMARVDKETWLWKVPPP